LMIAVPRDRLPSRGQWSGSRRAKRTPLPRLAPGALEREKG